MGPLTPHPSENPCPNYLLTALMIMNGGIFGVGIAGDCQTSNRKANIMKGISLSTDIGPFVERLKKIIATLFKFLDWFTPTHPFIADKRARTFLVSFTMLFFELLCIRWIPSYVRYLSYFNNFLLLAFFLVIDLGILSARRERL